MNKIFRYIGLFFMTFLITSCSDGSFFKKTDARKVSPNPKERVKKNLEEGKGFRLSNAVKNNRGGNFEFASSNELWRASLDVIEFLPLASANYSGGMIITDWYSDNANNDESLKISVRFMSNELRSDSLKILVHRKNCKISDNCAITLLPNNSKINSELLSVILQKAALLKEASKKKPAKK